MAGKGRLRAFLRWLRDPNANAKAIEFAGLNAVRNMSILMGRPIPPEVEQRYQELLPWFIRTTGQLPPH